MEIAEREEVSRAVHARRSRKEWLNRYAEVRGFTEKLAEPLFPEDCVIQSMPDASPTKWHLAHTTWFFETFVLKQAEPGYSNPISEYAYLFNSYYNAAGPQHCRARRGVISRPTLDETKGYRREVDERMLQVIERADEQSWRRIESIIELGLNHEQQHQELLLTDIKHVLAQNPLYPVYRERKSSSGSGAPKMAWVGFEEGLHWIGHEGNGFSYDNEGPRHQTFVQEFELGSRLVTNGEYLEFIEDGGYERAEFWLSLAWMTVRDQKWEAPLYWEKRDGQWHHFTLAGLKPVNLAEPVCHVSYFEADAFAKWAGARLPTEQEWEVASQDSSIHGNFVEAEIFHPSALKGQGSRGLQQIFGDLWEWTRSSYSPYPGYNPVEGALGEYNGKFMCNQYVLRGGSCATSQSHIRRTYRNFFAPDKRWQFMGIRLAK